MRNGRLIPCILAVLSVAAACLLAFAVSASAAPCADKKGPAADADSCVSGGPPSRTPASSATAPAGPASGTAQDGTGPGEAQPVVTGSGEEDMPLQETIAGQEPEPAPVVSSGSPSRAGMAASQAGSAPPSPSRSARTLTAAPSDSGGVEAGTVPVAGYLIATGGGLLLLSSAFGFMRFRPGAQVQP
ncbi:hypothetical protein LJR078_000107 [Arthrobacter sp. LjRoot78]|uniref:hypothetical protein n=1 Tax=Arthrobacter sp. LjRoot78 TaxID=3342338 RepID=UPI003ECF4E30